MTKFLLSLVLLFSNYTFANERHVQMGATFFELNNVHYAAVSLKNDKSWHTYWKNPGDAGIPIKLEFYADNNKLSFDELEWPFPKKYLEQGEVLAYGYSDTNHFYFKIPEPLKSQIKNKIITIKGHWLVCKEICIPGKDEINIKLNQEATGVNHPFKISQEEIKVKLSKLPILKKLPENLKVYLSKSKEENRLSLHYTFSNIDIKRYNTKQNLLTPFPAAPFDFKLEKVFWDSETQTLYGRAYIDWDGIYDEPERPLPLDGKFKTPILGRFLVNTSLTKQAIFIEYNFKDFSLTTDEELENFFSKLSVVNFGKKIRSDSLKDTAHVGDEKNILYYIFLAFLGGLILNLMPCVLPVISLKLFGLIVHSDETKEKILKHNLAYSCGVIFSFMILAFVVAMLKSGGEKIGWGFQLQSPVFVFFMMLMIFIMALNMFGLFEFVTPGGKTLGNAQIKKGISADFINGILATILSTPCSAPFLGVALSFAFTTSSFNIFLIFFFVGLGLSFPFILTGFFPKLISFLPKPGIWMDKLKFILGFSLILTAVWLYDVLSSLIDFSYSGIYINTIFALVFFAFFFRKHITKKVIWNTFAFILPVLMTMILIQNNGLVVDKRSTSSISNSQSNLKWSKWSEKRMKELSSDRKWVFIDFTAKWCLTCKVNKKVVLETDAFKKLVKENNIELLVADWTKRDDYITDFLRKYNIVGVPAYFLQSPSGKITYLGETISIGKIKDFLK